MIRANVLGRKYSKRLSKPDLKATFSDVCLVKTELKSNDLRIHVFQCFGKAIYRFPVYRRNPRDETESKQTTYNLGQNMLRHITKIPIFCTYPDKNAYSRKLKERFPPPLLQCCLRSVTEEMHTWAVKHQGWRGEEEGGKFVPFGHDGCMARNGKLH